MKQEQITTKNKMENPMRKPFISKLVLSAGATGTELEKSAKLLELLTDRKAKITKSGPRRRIPAFGVKPSMPLGAVITIRGEKAIALLKKFLGAIDNTIKKDSVSNNTLSFGIKEYIEIPEVEYVREIGIRGFNVTVSFERKGTRIKKRKINRGKLPKKQQVTRKEIIKFMEEKFNTKVE